MRILPSLALKCFVLSALLVVPIACDSTPPLDAKLRNYVLAVDGWGRPLDPGNQLAPYSEVDRKTKLSGGIKPFENQLDTMFKNIQDWQDQGRKDSDGKPSRKKILIFVHGGMVSSASALVRAESDYTQILGEDTYPIFINWNSEPFSSYGEHLLGIRHGQVLTDAWLDSPLYLFADLGRAITRAPAVWFKMLSHEFLLCNAAIRGEVLQDQNRRFTDDAEEGQVVVLTNYLHQPTTQPSIHVEFGEFVGKGGFSIPESIQYALLYPCRFILAPVLDGLGKPAWDNMCRRTSVLFDGEVANLPADLVEDPRKFVSPGEGPMVRFLHKLEDFQKAHPEFEITLVGHSMGAIVLDELVRQSIGHVFYSNIVYLAGASSARDFQRCVVPYLVAQTLQPTEKRTQFYNLCLHPVNDLRERVWYDVVPRGSLLVWIDDFLSEPATPLDRTMGRWDNIVQAVYTVPPTIAGQVHLKAFSFEEDEAMFLQNPQQHGQFTDVRYWDPTLWTSPPPTGDKSVWSLMATRAKEILP